MSIVNKVIKMFVGDKSTRDIKGVVPIVDSIKAEHKKLQSVSNDELREAAQKLRREIADFIKPEQDKISKVKKDIDDDIIKVADREEAYNNIDNIEKEIDEKIKGKLDDLLPQAFAIIKETATRFTNNEKIVVIASDYDRELSPTRPDIIVEGDTCTYHNEWDAGGTAVKWAMIHYDVQLIGGTILHQGKIAEMATGEGKTLVATLPVFLNALSGRGVHVVTVNDYLAKRDSEWMGTLYEFHGLSVDCIDKHQPNSDERKKAYNSDVTFGTNNEFGFDYLRDNMAISPDDLVQRRPNFAIVDEVDSVLIDDARTPLIISGPVSADKDAKLQFDELKPKVVLLFTEQRKLATKLLAEGKMLLAQKDDKKSQEEGAILILRAFKGLPKNKALIKYMSEPGIKTLVHETENTYLAENAKRMPEITDDLYFVIDEKNNGIEMTDKGNDLITQEIEDSKFFILPDIGAEIADLENSELPASEVADLKDKLLTDYSVKTGRIHTINQLLKAYAMFERDDAYVVMDNKVMIVDEQTGRIMDGRRFSDGLHQAIEAKENVKVEASTQTFATVTLQNYFRMYTKLSGMTGTAETEAGELWDIYKLDVVAIPTNRPIQRDDREDLVYKTKREKYNAVIYEINDLVKAGRPVLVGTTSVEISELLSRMLKIRNIKHAVLNAKLHQKEADIVAEAGKSGAVTIATNMAGRGTDIKLSPEVIEAGGLAIVGTARHDSRRVDRQLRGRAGRQGDAGSSQFFVSLEDNLMRMFGSDRISKMMDKMGLDEGEVIQHSMITKSIERAQKKVEENNFGIRKRLLEYDDVMNSQREVIYKQRRNALHGERVSVDIDNMIYDTCDSIVNQHHGYDFEEFKLDLYRLLAAESPVSEQEFMTVKPESLIGQLYQQVGEDYKRRKDSMVAQAFPVIKKVQEEQGAQFENIIVPVTDGVRTFNIMVNLKKAYDNNGKELITQFEKQLILHTIDESWKEHLREMDDLKQSVQNASIEQKDPLLIYKFESYELFKGIIDRNNKAIISVLLKSQVPVQEPDQLKEAHTPKKLDLSKYRTQKSEYSSEQQEQRKAANAEQGERQKVQPRRVEKRINRNDKVKVRFADGNIKEGKFKKFALDIEAGKAVVID